MFYDDLQLFCTHILSNPNGRRWRNVVARVMNNHYHVGVQEPRIGLWGEVATPWQDPRVVALVYFAKDTAHDVVPRTNHDNGLRYFRVWATDQKISAEDSTPHEVVVFMQDAADKGILSDDDQDIISSFVDGLASREQIKWKRISP